MKNNKNKRSTTRTADSRTGASRARSDSGSTPVSASLEDVADTLERGAGRPQGRKFWSASFFLIAVVVGVANVAHILVDRYYQVLESADPSGATTWMAAALALIGVTVVAGLWFAITKWRRTVLLFASLEFASAATGLVMLGTAVGTFILQKQPVERLNEYYGESLTSVFQGLHFFDLFHSFWFIAVLGLVGLSLAVDAGLRVRDIVVGRKDAWKNAGFILTHGGIVLLLVGGLVSMLYGDKGMVDLTKGMTAERYVRFEADSDADRVADLGFGLRLDDFELEYYDPAYSVYLFHPKGVRPDGRADFETVGAMDPSKKESWSFGDGYTIGVQDFDLPAAESTAKAGVTHELVLDGKTRVSVKVGQSVEFEKGVTVRVDKYLPHFNYDLKRKMAVSVSNRPENPTLEVTIRRGDAPPSTTWLFANNPGFSMGAHGGAADDFAKRLVYRFGRPEVALFLKHKGKLMTPPEGARLALGSSTVLFPPETTKPDDQWYVAFQEKGDRIKQYHSTVSIIDDGKVVIDKAPLSVNSPVSYGGFHLYQSNFRAYDLNYSGIQVTKDPGLNIVYAGMILMMIGVFYVLYFRRRKARPAATATDDGAEAGGEAADGDEDVETTPRAAAVKGS